MTTTGKTIRAFAGVAGLTVALALSSCAPSNVQTTEVYTGQRMPRPDHVLVSNFTASAQAVRLDQGLGSRVLRTVESQPINAQELADARKAQAALATALVNELRKYGLPAEQGSHAPAHGRTVLVNGQIVSIDEGNRTRRTLIGFGAGKSSMTADAQLLYATGSAPPQVLTAFQASTNSGRMPGVAVPIGVGAAAGRAAESAAISGGLHVAGETRAAVSDPNAQHLAEALGKQIAEFAASQGWVPPVPGR